MTNQAAEQSPAPQSFKSLPHDLEAEMSLLGSMMIDRHAISAVLPLLGRDEARWFYRPDHELLFGVLVDIYDANKEIDLVIVRDELQRRSRSATSETLGNLYEKIAKVEFLVPLAESVPSSANAEYYARIVRDKGVLRDLIRCSGEISQLAFEDNDETDGLLDQVEQKLFAVTERRITRQAVRLREMLEQVSAQIEMHHDEYLSGLATGFTELDELTSGFQKGDFIIVAGRPSMGKTALGLSIAEHMAADENKPVVFFSMEMSNQQIAQRILCARGRIDSHKFRRRMLGEDDVATLLNVCEELASAPLLVDDTPGMSVLELRAKARRLARQHDIQAVFVDYIQLMHTPGSESRQQEIAAISRGLKALGRELNVPVIAMAQLNRQAEGREGHRPRMSDLRESGALEQDADVILLIHREEYYKPQDPEAQGVAELIIAKQRNGPTDIVKLQFNKRLTRFANLSMSPEPAGFAHASEEVPF